MKVFEEIYGNIFTSEEEKIISKEYSRFLEEQKRIISNTETENDNDNDNDNGGDILGGNFSNIANSICENKTSKNMLIQNQEEKTKETSTFIGRKTKDLSGTGTHGSEAKDNQRDKKIRSSVSYLREIASNECTKCNVETFEMPTIKKQYGSSFVQNMSFFDTKFYKILCFQNEFKDDGKIHKDKSLINKNIIMKMLEKEKNELFIYLMKAKLSDYEEIGEKIKKYLSLDEKDAKLNAFKYNIEALINEIKTKMIDVRKKEIKTVNYITIKELED